MHTNKANKIQGQVCQKDCVSPLKSVMSVRCHCHLLHTEVRGYLCFLPLLLAFNKTLHLLSGSFLPFFLLYSAHNSAMLFKIKQPFSSEMLQSFLFVCMFALAQCMNIDKTNCAVQWIWGFFYPSFTHLLDTQACEILPDSSF